ncbi:MAG: FAD-dependent thymidylate synthase [Candidatus Heimdallarchaeota archaeon]|nr:FAD-dependent thymidylate synthase [Candidatus Heimdallarchaeota archaeon]
MEVKIIQVKLISYPTETDLIAKMAAAICYSGGHDFEEIRNKAEEKPNEYLSKIVKNGHLSILEHNVYVFHISGISRVTSHQLVRKRIASYSQQSQRYVDAKSFATVKPKSIEKSDFNEEYDKAMKDSYDLYHKMVENGIPKEDARYVLPSATTTQMIVSMNAHSLVDFFVRRLCTRAQLEITLLAQEMLKEVKKVSPVIFRDMGPYCEFYGYCPENDHSCGRAKTLKQIKENQK